MWKYPDSCDCFSPSSRDCLILTFEYTYTENGVQVEQCWTNRFSPSSRDCLILTHSSRSRHSSTQYGLVFQSLFEGLFNSYRRGRAAFADERAWFQSLFEGLFNSYAMDRDYRRMGPVSFSPSSRDCLILTSIFALLTGSKKYQVSVPLRGIV